MKSLKILHCPVTYLPTNVGGIEIYVNSLSRELRKLGHEVKVLLPQYPATDLYPEIHEGIPILTYDELMSTTKKEFQGKIKGKGHDDFIVIIKKENPDIVHFHQLTSSNGVSIFHIEAVKNLGIKVVYTNHLAGLTCSTGKLMYKGKLQCSGSIDDIKCAKCQLSDLHVPAVFDKAILVIGKVLNYFVPSLPDKKSKFATLFSFPQVIQDKRGSAEKLLELVDAFIVISNWYFQVLKLNGLANEKVWIIKQALPSFSQLHRETASIYLNSSIKLIYVGRISLDKGLDILLRAMNGLETSDISLDIFGMSDKSGYLEKCQSLRNINVTWHGCVDSSTIIDTIRGYDALILPSMIAEMAPLVIQEAFAAGRPVVGSDIGGIKEEIVNGKNGYLFEMGNIHELKDLLKSFIANKDLLRNLPDQISQIRTFQQIAVETQTIYEEICT
jgi:glycosyltransferase involved in cell wall biosynthesis